VTDTIWIGKLNEVQRRCDASREAIVAIEAGQTNAKVRLVYESLKGIPQIRWKESYKTTLVLELAAQPGLDI